MGRGILSIWLAGGALRASGSGIISLDKKDVAEAEVLRQAGEAAVVRDIRSQEFSKYSLPN